MYNLAVRKCTSPPLLAPAEPEAGMLPSEPARRALYKQCLLVKKKFPVSSPGIYLICQKNTNLRISSKLFNVFNKQVTVPKFHLS